MEKLEVTKSRAQTAFEKGTKEIKDAIANLFGREHFYKDIKEIVNGFEDALPLYIEKYGELDDFAKKLLCYSGSNKSVLASAALFKLEIAIHVLNGFKDPDYNDGKPKYEPLFDLSGSGFSFNAYDGWGTCSRSGSRLAYLDLDTMKHGVKILLPIYRTLYKK